MQQLKQVTIFGATGVSGKGITEILSKDYQIIAGQRKVPAESNNANVKYVECDVLNDEQVNQALEGSQAVVIAINGNRPFISNGSQNIIKLMLAKGITRLIQVSGISILEVEPGKYFKDTDQFPQEYAEYANDNLDTYQAIQKLEGLQYTVIACPMIYDTPETGEYETHFDKFGGTKNFKISNKDLGRFVSKELSQPTKLRTLVQILS